MKHLVIYAHPNPQSFNHAILETVVGRLEDQGNEVVVRDLYALNFEPVLSGNDFAAFQSGNTPNDIQTEQEHVKWADVITLIYPIWWTGLPAILKGYIDRVFAYGFAYAVNEQGGYEKLLAGKKAVVLNTIGHPEDYYEQIGMIGAMKQTTDNGIFDFVGIETLEHKFFGSVPSVDDNTRKQMLVDVEHIIARLFG
ncbi:NAD(P)H-dependent oxidoreductase [Cytobacillus sp. Hm23]|uniref:NAD(P)H-dependent oxidoreductase n=1 Tax=Cytobacillus sp. IB215665 TaxID=3097357 RepID=UPI002A0EBF00|nr:NAD(P)H-dependent oxidoreductase [Cytobacillus sp. IB215665]MDX8364668.1 NAD(P)H-dependent oxidoreductase [Cytobacillus sp. IB215665]